MIFGLLVLITALSISAVAIYYSVAGLVAIFAAAALPIMIMGGTLEIAKLVTAVWLHRHWKQATWWLRSYLSLAVVVLMLITSMGIFGFLSKAHIEQTSASEETVARVETLQKEIDRNLGIVGRAENRIRVLEASESNTSEDIQSQIDKEQERIDNAYRRIQPAIDEQNKIIADQTGLYSNELEALDNDFNQLQKWINEGGEDNIKKVQGMVGTTPDGDWGFLTSNAVDNWREANRAKRDELVEKIAKIADGNTVIENAREEIARLRKQADDQIKSSNKVIDRLRGRLADDDKAEDIQKSIDEQNERVRTASSEIDRLTEEKISLESQYRKLEAEVGPIKYIAEFIYGDTADKNMLEEAVRWVIITIIFVFDPLAVLLLLAAQYTFEFRRKDDNGDRLRLEREEYERARAELIRKNPGVDYENNRKETGETSEQTDSSVSEAQAKETVEGKNEDDPTLVASQESIEDVPEPITTTNDADGEPIPEADPSVADVPDQPVEQSEVQVDEEQPVEPKKKKPIEFSEESKKAREEEVEIQESDASWTDAKRKWKDEHPDATIKFHKQLYIDGHIDELPWATYHVERKNYIMKQDGEQVQKTSEHIVPDTDEGYIQNEEQNESSVWKRIRQDK